MVPTGEEVGVTSPQAKRFKSHKLGRPHHDVDVDLSGTSCLNDESNSDLGAASPTVGGAFDEDLTSHEHNAATLAIHPTPLISNHGDAACNDSLLFNEVHFHEQGHTTSCYLLTHRPPSCTFANTQESISN